MGFWAIDYIAHVYHVSVERKRFDSLHGLVMIQEHEVMLVKPQTYMNLSGTAVKRFAESFGVALSDMLIITDDVNLSFGTIRLRPHGTAGGHNGLSSIIECMGSREFARLRMGVDAPPHGVELADYVLSAFSAQEKAELENVCSRAHELCCSWLAGEVSTTR
jgi:PTH1 family peptidyl-tRNA hydrolase